MIAQIHRPEKCSPTNERPWKSLREELLCKIYRIPGLSQSAKTLWGELALNWCWRRPECCPSAQMLAVALCSHRNSISKWCAELIKFGLLTLVRTYRGYHYLLTTEIPDELMRAKWRFNNRSLARRVRKKTNDSTNGAEENHDAMRRSDALRQKDEHLYSGPAGDAVRLGRNAPKQSDAHKMGIGGAMHKECEERCPRHVHRSGARLQRALSDAQDMGMDESKYLEAGREEEEKKKKKKKKEEEEERELRATHAIDPDGGLEMGSPARCARGYEGRAGNEGQNEEQRTYEEVKVQPNELPEFTADSEHRDRKNHEEAAPLELAPLASSDPLDPAPVDEICEGEEEQHEESVAVTSVPDRQRRRRQRGRNSPDPSLVAKTLPGISLRDAGKPCEGRKVIEPSTPPPRTSEDVLELLRGEIEKKYGSKGCKGLPFQLNGKLKRMIKTSLLNSYAPDVIIAMIRVLVWDWEVARQECFPYRAGLSYPTIESLVQYKEFLSSLITTGFTYTGNHRGAWKTYRSEYLDKEIGNDVSDELPF